MELARAVEFIKANDNFLLVAHVSPDGDTLGSCLALHEGLLQLNKRAQIACEEPVPPNLKFLDEPQTVVNANAIAPFDNVIFVDCADFKRTGDIGAVVEGYNSLCIDHHDTNKGYANVNYVEHCAATGEIVFLILKQLGVEINADIATRLFAALATDTGNFSYSNTTPRTFEMAGELLKTGFNLSEVNRKLFRTNRVQRVRLMGLLSEHMQLFCNGKAAISHLCYSQMSALGATSADCEGLIDILRDIDTVEVACFVRESASGLIRVSMRAKHEADVSKITVKYGGGGHSRAAGCNMDCTIDEAVASLKVDMAELLQ